MKAKDNTHSLCRFFRGGKVLVFGASGQDGRFVCETSQSLGAEVLGVSRNTTPACDVSRFEEVDRLVSEFQPNFVFQLAAESRTAHTAIFENHAAISTGALNIFESIHRHQPTARVLLAASGVQFHNSCIPIHEQDSFEASSPYSASRIYSVYLARYFRERMGLRTYVAYLFHHESPFRSNRHTSKMLASAAARAALGGNGVLTIGDPSVEKEWAFAGDIVEAMFWLMHQEKVFECVIGTGEGHTIEEWLEACYGYVGLNWRNFIKQVPGFVAEYPKLVSNPQTIFSIGWRPKVTFSELAVMMVDFELDRIKVNGLQSEVKGKP